MGADWYSVWGLSGLSKLSVGKARQLGECVELQWTAGMGLDIIGVDWEVDWGGQGQYAEFDSAKSDQD